MLSINAAQPFRNRYLLGGARLIGRSSRRDRHGWRLPCVGRHQPRSYTVTFTGSGAEHHVDQQKNIQDDGTCNSAEHVDVTATVAWSSAWRGLSLDRTECLSGADAQIAGSRVAGTHVKDACGLPLDDAPEGWVLQQTVQRRARRRRLAAALGREQDRNVDGARIRSAALGTSGHSAVPAERSQRSIAGHLVVPLKKLQALKKHASLTCSRSERASRARRPLHAGPELLAADEALRGLPHGGPLPGHPVLDGLAEDHPTAVATRARRAGTSAAHAGARRSSAGASRG